MTGLALFHNHLGVDTAAPAFLSGSRSFVRLREQFRMNVFDAAVAEDRSPIFTFRTGGSASADFAPVWPGLCAAQAAVSCWCT
jgi:hypothetical protein